MSVNNWNGILSNTRNLNDVLIILRKVLAQLSNKVDITQIDEIISDLENISEVNSNIQELKQLIDRSIQFFENEDDLNNIQDGAVMYDLVKRRFVRNTEMGATLTPNERFSVVPYTGFFTSKSNVVNPVAKRTWLSASEISKKEATGSSAGETLMPTRIGKGVFRFYDWSITNNSALLLEQPYSNAFGMPICSMETSVDGGAYDLGLFVPVFDNADSANIGSSIFKYVGKEPLVVNITGHFNLLLHNSVNFKANPNSYLIQLLLSQHDTSEAQYPVNYETARSLYSSPSSFEQPDAVFVSADFLTSTTKSAGVQAFIVGKEYRKFSFPVCADFRFEPNVKYRLMLQALARGSASPINFAYGGMQIIQGQLNFSFDATSIFSDQYKYDYTGESL